MIHTRQNAVDVIKYICGVFYMLRKGCTTMKLYHYYEKDNGPFRSISDLPDKEAEEVLRQIRLEKPDIFLSKRPDDYLLKRRHFEEVLRNEFIKMGGVRLYSYEEILKIIDKYGLPQIWNPDFKYGPECYIEVQIWTDRGLEKWLKDEERL